MSPRHELPTKAERDAMRDVLANPAFGAWDVAPLRLLLEWADAQEVGELPALRALRRLVRAYDTVNRPGHAAESEKRECRAARAEAEALLAGEPLAHRGPWALRHGQTPNQRIKGKAASFWLRSGHLGNTAGGEWWTWEHRHLFTKLGPASEEGTARWAQRLHGGVIVRVKGASK